MKLLFKRLQKIYKTIKLLILIYYCPSCCCSHRSTRKFVSVSTGILRNFDGVFWCFLIIARSMMENLFLSPQAFSVILIACSDVFYSSQIYDDDITPTIPTRHASCVFWSPVTAQLERCKTSGWKSCRAVDRTTEQAEPILYSCFCPPPCHSWVSHKSGYLFIVEHAVSVSPCNRVSQWGKFMAVSSVPMFSYEWQTVA